MLHSKTYNLRNNNFLFFGYFLYKTNWTKLKNDLNYAKNESKKSILFLAKDMILTSWQLGFSLHEYFYYGFFLKEKSVRQTYSSMAYMYLYQLRCNPPGKRNVLQNKIVFLKKYEQFTKRKWLDLSFCSSDQISVFLRENARLVLKNATGGAGKNIKIINTEGMKPQDLINIARKNKFNLLEEFVSQHKDLASLSPNSLNTIRIITQITPNETVDIIGTILRLSIGKDTDNLSTGGIACPIDPLKGVISGPGVSFEIGKKDYFLHPVTGLTLIGFKIPFWEEALEICRKAALFCTDNKSIGWDVAITSDGPLLIEGNHDWGARLWQMPAKKGLRNILEAYC